SPRIRQAIKIVLEAVQRYPRDLGRLRRRLLGFRYVAAEDNTTAGQWRVDANDALRLHAERDAVLDGGFPMPLRLAIDPLFHAKGWIELSRRVARHSLMQ